ncbi:hypothetical protein D918_02544 [Trichuris suis]|nr:hypothetical protein D918_02544 [Trichuris suis]
MGEIFSPSSNECQNFPDDEPVEQNELSTLTFGDEANGKVKRKCLFHQHTQQCGKKPCQFTFSEDSPQCSLIGASASQDDPVVADDEEEALTFANEKLDQWIDEFQRWTNSDKIRALGRLVKNCSLIQLRELHKTIEPYFQRDFISHLPKEVSAASCLA